MEAKITIEDDTNCVVLTLEEAEELYEQLKKLFSKDDTKVDYWLDTPWKDFNPTGWKDPTTTGPTSTTKDINNNLQECGKHYMYEICDCAMENR